MVQEGRKEGRKGRLAQLQLKKYESRKKTKQMAETKTNTKEKQRKPRTHSSDCVSHPQKKKKKKKHNNTTNPVNLLLQCLH